MDGEQKNKLFQFFTFNLRATRLFVALSLFVLSFLSLLLFVPSTAYADGNCPGSERQGDPTNPKMPDPNKCYTVNATTGNVTATASVPTGAATGGQAVPNQTPISGANQDDATCAVEKIGWIVCPILEGMARISDNMFDVLANNFLSTDVSLIRETRPGGEASGTKMAWEVARNLANIMFIIAFIAIILSQVTNMGINNYGIKKMLPRLVIAAIAVNVSYYICQIVVDLTNILGYEIQNVLSEIANSIGPSVFGNASEYNSSLTTGGGQGLGNAKDAGVLTVIIIAALATTAAWLILGPGIAVISGVIITVLAIILILMLRKALIVLLIVVSPIAFVLYLLPNTEKFFSKWMKMFGQILMVFPVIGLLFGAGQLASTIILVSGATDDPKANAQCDPNAPSTSNSTSQSNSAGTYTGKCDGYIQISGTRGNPGDFRKTLCGEQITTGQDTTNCKKGASWTLGLVAMGVAVAPMMASYAVLKGALSAAGAIGGTINSMATKGRNGAGKWSKGMDERRQKRAEIRALNGRGNFATGWAHRRRANRAAINAGLDNELQRSRQTYIAEQVQGGNQRLANQIAGGGVFRQADPNAVQRALDRAQITIDKVQAEEVEAGDAQITQLNLTSDQQREIRNNGSYTNAAGQTVAVSDSMRHAALKRAVTQGDIAGIEEAMTSTNSTAETRRYLGMQIERNYGAIKQKGAHLVNNDLLDDLRGGGAVDDARLDQAMNEAMGSMSAELMASQKGVALNRVQGLVSGTRAGGTAQNIANAKGSARALRTNQQVFAGVAQNDRRTVHNIAT